jgi:hypothetical protein
MFFTLLPVIKLIKDHWHRILRSFSFDNNGLVKPSCGTVALYGPFGFFYDMTDYP